MFHNEGWPRWNREDIRMTAVKAVLRTEDQKGCKPLRELCFPLSRYRRNWIYFLCSESRAAPAAVPAACGPASGACSAHSCCVLTPMKVPKKL